MLCKGREGPLGVKSLDRCPVEAELRSYAHSVMSRLFLPLLRINGTNHLLPSVAEFQHHLSHLHAVLLLQPQQGDCAKTYFPESGS